MKILSFLAFSILALSQHAMSQELIPNGGFEQYYGCNISPDDIDSAKFWTMGTTEGTSDYFNACSNFAVNVPNTFAGYQPAHTGDAFAGLCTYLGGNVFPPPPYREYIETSLLRPLTKDSLYLFEMFINAANKEQYITSNIGAYFSDTLVKKPIRGVLPFSAQITNAYGNYPDTVNWLRVAGTYRAHGGERFIIIGNFQPDALVDTVNQLPSATFHASYMFVDDASLKPAYPEDVSRAEIRQPIIISPLPVGEILNIETNSLTSSDVTVYDISGRILIQRTFNGTTKLNMSNLAAGVYILRLNCDGITLKVTKFSKQ